MWTKHAAEKWLVLSMLVAALAILAPRALCADKPDDKAKDAVKTKKKDDAAKAKDAKATKEAKDQPRGRLPAYYRQVVDDAQRDKIYAIQLKYRADRDKIGEEIKRVTSDLRKQLAELKAKQDGEIESLLTAEQRTKLEKLRADALAERKKAAALKKSAPKKRDASKTKEAK